MSRGAQSKCGSLGRRGAFDVWLEGGLSDRILLLLSNYNDEALRRDENAIS